MRLPRLAPSFLFLISTLALLLAFAAPTLYAWHRASAIDELAQAIATNADPSIRHLDDTRTELHAMAMLVNGAVFDQARRSPFPRAAFERHRQSLHTDVGAYLALPSLPAERARWDAMKADLTEAEAQLDAVVEKLQEGDVAGAAALRDGELGVVLERADVDLGGLIAFNADLGSRLSVEIGQRKRAAQTTSYLLHGVAVLVALAMLGFSTRASRQYVLALRRAHEADAAMTRRLEAVAGAAVTITEDLRRDDPRDLLQTIVGAAGALVGADVATLGLGKDPSQPLRPLVHAGADPSLAEEPAAGPLIRAVVRHEHERVGLLTLARRPGAPNFTEQDARAVELLSTLAGTAIQNAKLYAELRTEVARREDLLSIVSHDLRNPLSAIVLGAQTLRRKLGGEAPGRRHAEVIARNAARMDRMIADLLAAAKLQEGGVLPIEPKAQEAAPLVREAVEAFAGTAADKGVALRVEIAGEVPPVYCDAGRIGQVLSNLVGNALKFTATGGSIVVSAGVAPADGEVSFAVRDTGVGIPEKALAHVFERFWQDQEHAARGTGLGLYIAKGIVDAHRGRIWVTSRVGQGSDFRFTVPAASWPDDVRGENGAAPPGPAVSRPG